LLKLAPSNTKSLPVTLGVERYKLIRKYGYLRQSSLVNKEGQVDCGYADRDQCGVVLMWSSTFVVKKLTTFKMKKRKGYPQNARPLQTDCLKSKEIKHKGILHAHKKSQGSTATVVIVNPKMRGIKPLRREEVKAAAFLSPGWNQAPPRQKRRSGT
jgi:hypothetical protein